MVINIETVNRLYNDYIKRVNEFSEAKIPDSVQLEFEEIGEPAHYSDMTKNVIVNLKMIKDKNHLKAVVIHELRHAQQDIMVENFKDGKKLKDVNNDSENWLNNKKNYIDDISKNEHYLQPLELDAYAFTHMILDLDKTANHQTFKQVHKIVFIKVKNLAKKMIQTYKTIK